MKITKRKRLCDVEGHIVKTIIASDVGKRSLQTPSLIAGIESGQRHQ